MPRNGETNQKFGLYRTVCCGKEIILQEGDRFPDCPNHPGLTTLWKSVDDIIVPLRKPWTSELMTPQFQIGDEVVFVGVGPKNGKHGDVVEVIEGSVDNVCRYRVKLFDNTWIRCFGFELELDLTSFKSA